MSDRLDDNKHVDDEIFIYLDKNRSNYSYPIILNVGNVAIDINIFNCEQGNTKRLESYIYQNGEWHKITKKSEVLVSGSYYNEELLGTFPENLYDKIENKRSLWDLTDEGIIATPKNGCYEICILFNRCFL